MSDILVESQSYQSSSAPTIFSDQFTFGVEYQSTSSACIVDITPPVFAGITSLDVESRGQIRAMWGVATDPTPPIRYEVYVKPVTATGLFLSQNIIAITDKLQFDIFELPDGTLLVNGTAYYVGVKAIDGVNNRDANVVTLSVISTGVLTSIDIYETKGAFTAGIGGLFQGTMWILKNSELGLGATLGTAAYQVYDKAGALVSGMSQSGIAADANGQFKITPTTSALTETLNHYLVKVSITMDSEVRNSYVPLVEKLPSYNVAGHQAFDISNNLIGVFWAEDESGVHVTGASRLGNGSYDALDKDGNVVFGFSETGIVPNAQGVYVITPVPGVSPADLLLTTGRVTIVVDGLPRTSLIPVFPVSGTQKVMAQFSINALNQLQATFWASNEGEDSNVVLPGPTLGVANYTIYDAAGVAVSGLTQSGIVADANGRFHIAPVSALLLTDLTHYSVKIGIVIHTVEHIAYKGFSLLGN